MCVHSLVTASSQVRRASGRDPAGCPHPPPRHVHNDVSAFTHAIHSRAHSLVCLAVGTRVQTPPPAGRAVPAAVAQRSRGGGRAVSVAEIPAPAQPYDAFERTPPQDVSAEQCVLGGMLLSKDAIADVVEVLRSADFYKPAHQTVYDTVLDLYGRGEPADPVTVAAELTRRGEIARIGGAPYLHTLI